MSGGVALSLLSIASDAGRTVNEDAAESAGRSIWVLDGATGISDRNWTPGPTDAAWISHYASNWLRHHAGNGPVANRLHDLQEDLARAFARDTDLAAVPHEETPSACLGLVEHDPARETLDIVVVGDVSVLIALPDGNLLHLTDSSVEPFSSRSLAIFRNARDQGASRDEAWQHARAAMRENRRWVNRAGGYWVVNPVLPWQDGLRHHAIAAPEGTRILLATDGFFRMVDILKQWDIETLMTRSFGDGLHAVIETLRAVERADPDCMTYGRIKVHDDASAILAELRRVSTH